MLERQKGATIAEIEPKHVERYSMALPFCEGMAVLDAACGCGYGSSILAKSARSVVGVDRSDEAIEYAKEHWIRGPCTFLRHDLDVSWEIGFRPEVIVSFETIEHLNMHPKDTLRAVSKILDENGLLIFSHPIMETSKANTFHKWFNLDSADMLSWAKAVGFTIEKSVVQKARAGGQFDYHIVIARLGK
jgi:2-polyprenyl-3-methyl-5-hydroxy-6-metoxy-1,4-benzoquinol methylase